MLIWTLSLEGNKAAARQTKALAEAISARPSPDCPVTIRPFYPAPPAHTSKIAEQKGVTWTQVVPIQELAGLGFQSPWPDILIGCCPEVAGIALGIKAASAGQTALVHIQDPNGRSGLYNFATAAFDLLLLQPHEQMDGHNFLKTPQALHSFTPDYFKRLRREYSAILSTLRQPVLTVLIGGSDSSFTYKTGHIEKMARDLHKTAQEHHGSVLVITSRRSGAVSEALRKNLPPLQNVFFNDPRFGYDLSLAAAQHLIITGDSRSMIDEARATGMPCSIYDLDGALARHPTLKSLKDQFAAQKLFLFPHKPKGITPTPKNIMPWLAGEVRQRLKLG